MNPNFKSLPWICGAPQPFSLAIWWMRVLIAGSSLGLPTLPLDFIFQKSLNPFRCQEITVSGLTIISADFQWGHTDLSDTQNSRSNNKILGLTDCDLKTASCCRKAKSSKSFEILSLNKIVCRAFNNSIIRINMAHNTPIPCPVPLSGIAMISGASEYLGWTAKEFEQLLVPPQKSIRVYMAEIKENI